MNRPWQRAFHYRPTADRLLCHFMRRRLTLPTLSLAALFDDFDEQPITITQLPRGGWSTPLADVVMLLKLAACTRPRRIMEIGSFRGYTSLFLAQHLEDASLVTVDRYPEHGEAYRGLPCAARIERRIGETAPTLFAPDQPNSYDLIFVDAGHDYPSVKNDSELTLPLLTHSGYMVWHDYANWGYFSGYNGVPEYLKELSMGRPVAHVIGSDLAIYSPTWADEGPARDRFLAALRQGGRGAEIGADPWSIEQVRG